MCKMFCRTIATIYLSFILGLIITVIYYVLQNDNTKYITIPLSVIGVGVFMVIICNILFIFKDCCFFPKILPLYQPKKKEIVELKEAALDENNFIIIVIDDSYVYASGL